MSLNNQYDIRIGTLAGKGSSTPDYIRAILPHGFESFQVNFWQMLGDVELERLAEETQAALDGYFYASIGDKQDQPIDAQELMVKVAAVLRRSPNTPVMVKGDNAVNYGQVVTVMALLQQAGAPSVGLITKQPEEKPAKK